MGLAPVLHCSNHRQQSIMKILVIADPWLEESQCWCISIHLTLTCSHKKGLFDHFVSSIMLGSNVTSLHQDEQSTRTSFSAILRHQLPIIPLGLYRCPFLWLLCFCVRASVIHWNRFITRMIIWCINIQFTLLSGFLNCAAETACPMSIH